MCTFLNYHASSLSLGTDSYIYGIKCVKEFTAVHHIKDKNLKNTLLEKKF